MSARDEYPILAHNAKPNTGMTREITRALDEIDRLRAEVARRHDATVCRHVATTQQENINRLSAECDALTALLDAERALADKLAKAIRHDFLWSQTEYHGTWLHLDALAAYDEARR